MGTVVPEGSEISILEYLWYDRMDHRYVLTGPNACSQEAYDSTVLVQQFAEALKSNPNATPPAGLPDDIVAEEQYIAQMEREGR